MRNGIIWAAVLLSILLLNDTDNSQNSRLLVQPQELYDALATGEGRFVDLRTEKSYNKLHIVGFELLTYDEDELSKLAKEEQPIYLICETGRTSATAYNFLLDKGADEVYAAVFGVNEYAETMGIEGMDGAEICIPCVALQKEMEGKAE